MLRFENKLRKKSFLMKIDDKKGHVFELMCSDELYNFARGGVKRSILGINRSTFCFGKKIK